MKWLGEVKEGDGVVAIDPKTKEGKKQFKEALSLWHRRLTNLLKDEK